MLNILLKLLVLSWRVRFERPLPKPAVLLCLVFFTSASAELAEHVAATNSINHQTETEVVTTERKSLTQLGVSTGYSYFENFEHTLDMRYTYLWDMGTFWPEAIFGLKVAFKDKFYFYEPGFRILYPFSNEGNIFYIGSGGGFSKRMTYLRDNKYAYGWFVENSLGYLVWRNNYIPMRIEAFATGMFYDEKSIGGGIRIITGIRGKISDSEKAEIEEARKKKKAEAEEKGERKHKIFRFAYGSYNVSLPEYNMGQESSSNIMTGIVLKFPIRSNIAFEPGLNLGMRRITYNDVIHYTNGYSYYHTDEIKEWYISIPTLFKIMPLGGPTFYIEGGAQIELPFDTELGYANSYESRAAFDFGLACGFGWNFKSFVFGLRGIKGLTNFNKDYDENKPIQIEWSIGF